MSEVALLLANIDRLQQVEDYIRGCTTYSEYWPTWTGWRLCQRLHYFYQTLTISTSWKLSQRQHMTMKNGLALFTGFIDKYLIEETAVLNVLTDPRKTISCDSRCSQISYEGKYSCLCWFLQGESMTDEESMFSAFVFPGWLKSVCFSFLILHPVFVLCGTFYLWRSFLVF